MGTPNYDLDKIYDEICGLVGDSARVLRNEPLKNHTTFKVGGPADIFVEAGSSKEIAELTALLKDRDLPYMCIGNGSNLLVLDGGFRGVIIHIGNEMAEIVVEGETVRAGAGAMLSAVAQAAAAASLTGLEFASGIPGSLGGAVFMNAGAYGGEMAQVITRVTALMPDGSVQVFEAEENGGQLDFGYRHSAFCENGGIVIEAEMGLKTGAEEDIRSEMRELNRRRVEKQPLNFPSAGSTFKRPEGHFAGQLIQEAGLKGLTLGGAQVSSKHAGFVINADNASAQDILDLIKLVQLRVKDTSGVDLETEVLIIGEA